MKIEPWMLKQRQSLPLEAKVVLAQRRIREFYDEMEGQIYVSVSGKDSLVAFDIARKIYPRVKGVFCNTRMEFPEIVRFWRKVPGVEFIYPEQTYQEVIENKGYPVISKKISMGVSRYRNTKSEVQRDLRLNGGVNPSSGKKQARTIPISRHYLVNAPFKISEECCDVMKKRPLKKFYKETGLAPITGEMAQDSRERQEKYLQHGCNAFDTGLPKSKPLSVWLEEDIWQYIRENGLEYPEVYDMGYDRTGCMFCTFGIMNDDPLDNRFQKMKRTHPKQYEYCINKLGMGKVLDYIGIDYGQCDHDYEYVGPGTQLCFQCDDMRGVENG